MADFCSFCEDDWVDIDLVSGFEFLKEDGDFYGPFICEGCGMRCIFRDGSENGMGFGNDTAYREYTTKDLTFDGFLRLWGEVTSRA